MHPRQIALLSDKLLWDIIGLFAAMFKLGYAPSAVVFILIRLIPKPLGGVRPIGLFTALLRVFLRALRRTIGEAWASRNIPLAWYGVKGKSSEQAVWSRLAAVRYAKDTGGVAMGERVGKMQKTWSSWSASIDDSAGVATMQLIAVESHRVATEKASLEAIRLSSKAGFIFTFVLGRRLDADFIMVPTLSTVFPIGLNSTPCNALTIKMTL